MKTENKSFTLQELKKRILPILKCRGIIKAGIFGSIVRGEYRAGSDIDILIEFKKGKSLFDLARLEIELEEKLRAKVDILTYNSIHYLLKDQVLKEDIKIL